jgi:four helix bundle protein
VNRESLHCESAPQHRAHVSTFEDLEVYRVAREFRKAMYQIAKQLPEVEKFGLASQMRRAAVSLTNNIAEGHGRYHYLDQIKFTLHSRGSLEELLDDLNVCEDEQYVPVDEIAPLREDGWRVRQLIDGYVRYLRQQSTNRRGSSVREDSPAYDEDIDDSRFTM